MSEVDRLTTLCALLIDRQVRIEAQQEITLKCLAHFVGATTGQDWRPIHADLDQQVAELVQIRRREVEQVFARLQGLG